LEFVRVKWGFTISSSISFTGKAFSIPQKNEIQQVMLPHKRMRMNRVLVIVKCTHHGEVGKARLPAGAEKAPPCLPG
jgi:hypothetical protein